MIAATSKPDCQHRRHIETRLPAPRAHRRFRCHRDRAIAVTPVGASALQNSDDHGAGLQVAPPTACASTARPAASWIDAHTSALDLISPPTSTARAERHRRGGVRTAGPTAPTPETRRTRGLRSSCRAPDPWRRRRSIRARAGGGHGDRDHRLALAAGAALDHRLAAGAALEHRLAAGAALDHRLAAGAALDHWLHAGADALDHRLALPPAPRSITGSTPTPAHSITGRCPRVRYYHRVLDRGDPGQPLGEQMNSLSASTRRSRGSRCLRRNHLSSPESGFSLRRESLSPETVPEASGDGVGPTDALGSQYFPRPTSLSRWLTAGGRQAREYEISSLRLVLRGFAPARSSRRPPSGDPRSRGFLPRTDLKERSKLLSWGRLSQTV